jgi:hypothetical protein
MPLKNTMSHPSCDEERSVDTTFWSHTPLHYTSYVIREVYFAMFLVAQF